MQSVEDMIQEMEKAGGQYALTSRYRHPSAQSVVRKKSGGRVVFDLEKVAGLLSSALAFVEEVGRKKGTILFVSTRQETVSLAQKTAESLSLPYMLNRWIGGTISNFKNVRSRVERMENLAKELEDGARTSLHTKKERVLLTRELSKLRSKFSGIASMADLPAAVLIFDARREKIAVDEALRSNIPVIGVSNADADIRLVHYPVPVNICSRSVVAYLLALIEKAYRKGRGE